MGGLQISVNLQTDGIPLNAIMLDFCPLTLKSLGCSMMCRHTPHPSVVLLSFTFCPDRYPFEAKWSAGRFTGPTVAYARTTEPAVRSLRSGP